VKNHHCIVVWDLREVCIRVQVRVFTKISTIEERLGVYSDGVTSLKNIIDVF
jgi:hypothetical protein